MSLGSDNEKLCIMILTGRLTVLNTVALFDKTENFTLGRDSSAHTM